MKLKYLFSVFCVLNILNSFPVKLYILYKLKSKKIIFYWLNLSKIKPLDLKFKDRQGSFFFDKN